MKLNFGKLFKNHPMYFAKSKDYHHRINFENAIVSRTHFRNARVMFCYI